MFEGRLIHKYMIKQYKVAPNQDRLNKIMGRPGTSKWSKDWSRYPHSRIAAAMANTCQDLDRGRQNAGGRKEDLQLVN
ncbi:unnamed protein product, partial [Allacma fusca]